MIVLHAVYPRDDEVTEGFFEREVDTWSSMHFRLIPSFIQILTEHLQ